MPGKYLSAEKSGILLNKKGPSADEPFKQTKNLRRSNANLNYSKLSNQLSDLRLIAFRKLFSHNINVPQYGETLVSKKTNAYFE